MPNTKIPRTRGKKGKKFKLTFKATLHLHDLLPIRTLNHIRRVQMEMLLDNAAQVVAVHVEHLLAPRDAHDLALDLEHRRAVGQLDAEAVARQRHDFFFQHQRFGARG